MICHEGLLELKKHDEENQTQYMETLRVYLEQCHLTEIMNPQIRLLTASYIQSRLRLHILPSQIHMSCHHPAVSGFQISIPDKINQLSGYFICR